jgi:hypothetical protein
MKRKDFSQNNYIREQEELELLCIEIMERDGREEEIGGTPQDKKYVRKESWTFVSRATTSNKILQEHEAAYLLGGTRYQRLAKHFRWAQKGKKTRYVLVALVVLVVIGVLIVIAFV